MDASVIDTNVPVVANGRTPQASLDCAMACVAAIRSVQQNGIIVLDRGGRILSEYHRHLSPSGQPGPGDLFMKWVWIHQAVGERCEQVEIKPRNDRAEDFEEFPDDPELATFDRSDRKFVAVALASRNQPEVLNAVDSDWWDHRVSLRRHGVRIRFLCAGQFP